MKESGKGSGQRVVHLRFLNGNYENVVFLGHLHVDSRPGGPAGYLGCLSMGFGSVDRCVLFPQMQVSKWGLSMEKAAQLHLL